MSLITLPAAVNNRRDRALARAGFRVLRLPAQLALHDLAAALQLVTNALG